MTVIPAPSSLFIETTTECHLRCRMCHIWMNRDDATRSLRTDEKVALVEEMARWVSRAAVVLTGGETMRNAEEFFRISTTCLDLRLSCAANTSGTLITRDVVDRLLVEGPKYLVLSLDSHHRGLHDNLRGVAGTWDRVTTAIQALVRRRRESFASTHVRVMVNCILLDANLDEVDAFIEFANSLGVDGIMFQPLARTFALRSNRDAFFERNVPRNCERVDMAIDAIRSARQRGRPIVTSDGDLRYIGLYARNPDFVVEPVCASARRNMMVDVNGNVQLCFNMHSLVGRVLGNVREHSLRSLWESDFAEQARGVMDGCRKSCGMLNCHRRVEAS